MIREAQKRDTESSRAVGKRMQKDEPKTKQEAQSFKQCRRETNAEACQK